MPPDLDEPLSTALSALRLEALAGPLSAAGLCSLETLESDVLASRTHFLARLKEAQVGTIPQRQALANGLLRRRRDGDAPVWLRPSDRHLQLSAWHWQSYADASRPAAAASAPGAYLRARWRAADGPAAPALAVSSRAGEPLPMVLTVRYAGCAPTRLRPVADAAGLVALPAPPAEEVHVYELTVQIEAAVQSADRWGATSSEGDAPPRPPPASLRLCGLVLPPRSVPLPPPTEALRLLAFGDSITEGVLCRTRSKSDEGGDLGCNSVSSAWAWLLAQSLGADATVVSFGRQGWTVAGNGGAPAFCESWRSLCAGAARFGGAAGGAASESGAASEGVPDLVLVNQGTNDALCGAADDAVRAAAHAWLWGARAALGATPLLALVLPFGGFCAAPLRAAFADYQRGAEWLRAVAAAADAAGPTDGGDELSGASERSLDSNTSTDTACESTDTNATEECRRFAVSPPRDERCLLLDLGREAADGLGGWAPRGPASADGIHPSGSKHRRLAALAEAALRAAPPLTPPTAEAALRAAPPLTPPTPRVRPPRRAAHAVRVFGDSNLHALLDAEGAGYTCLVHVFLAGSAMGLAREDSHSGYRAALLDDLRRVPRGDSVVLKFGQVDCDFVYYLKLVHDASLTFEAHLARSVERYFAFIDGALAAGHLRHEDLYIATPFPTGVVDAHLREALCSLPLMAKAGREAFRRALDDHLFLPTEAERVAHGRAYSAALAAAARARGLPLIDTFSPLLGADGLCRVKCVGANHHLPPAAEPFAAAALARHCLGRSDGDAEPPPGDPAGALADPAGRGEAVSPAGGLQESEPGGGGAAAGDAATRAGEAEGEGGHDRSAPAPEAAGTAGDGLSAVAVDWILACAASAPGGAAPLRARGHVLASWRHLAALLGAPAALGREFATQGPHHAQWVVRLLRGCDAPVAVLVRGRFSEHRAERRYAWAVESTEATAPARLQRAIDSSEGEAAGAAVAKTGEADAATAAAMERLRRSVGVEAPPRVRGLTVPQLMRTPVAGALVAAARQAQEARGEG